MFFRLITNRGPPTHLADPRLSVARQARSDIFAVRGLVDLRASAEQANPPLHV